MDINGEECDTWVVLILCLPDTESGCGCGWSCFNTSEWRLEMVSGNMCPLISLWSCKLCHLDDFLTTWWKVSASTWYLILGCFSPNRFLIGFQSVSLISNHWNYNNINVSNVFLLGFRIRVDPQLLIRSREKDIYTHKKFWMANTIFGWGWFVGLWEFGKTAVTFLKISHFLWHLPI